MRYALGLNNAPEPLRLALWCERFGGGAIFGAGGIPYSLAEEMAISVRAYDFALSYRELIGDEKGRLMRLTSAKQAYDKRMADPKHREHIIIPPDDYKIIADWDSRGWFDEVQADGGDSDDQEDESLRAES